MRKIKVIVEKTGTGYSAFAEDFPVATTGKTIDKLKSNILEALNLYFEEEKNITGLLMQLP
jgi:predicted RNase H-like HicB family nuclease